MARLTILQASQQGFGSTLTIHRHIKDGSLPVYEEGDNKLLEVDDLISLLGEPGAPLNDEQVTAVADRIDIYEYNRMKSELDQKNKKNMWLAADLAEVVRELKDKEAKFDAERDRLLKVLEQAQALLLREGKRIGGGVKNVDGSAVPLDQVAANGDAANLAQPQAPAFPENKSLDTPMDPPVAQPPGNDTSGDETAIMPNVSLGEPLPPKGEENLAVPTLDAESPDAGPTPAMIIPGLPSETLADDPPSIIVDAENRPKNRAKSRNSVNPVNPLIPPPEEAVDEPKKSRLMSTTTWLLLLTLVGGGFVFFKFRTQIMSSVEQIMKTLSGA